LTQICTKSFVGWGFAPDPTEGAYSAPPDPIAVFRWPLLRERGEIGQRMGREKGKGERRGKRRRGKGRGGKRRAP